MNGWKITAIIFMTLFIIETSFIFWSVDTYNKMEEKDNECFFDICKLGESNEYDQYYFDTNSNLCSCYKDEEIALQKLIK